MPFASLAIVAALLILLYTYVGYPILIYLLARTRPTAFQRDTDYTPTVSICIPVFNGAEYLESKLRSLTELDYPADRIEILVYSDGSTDETCEIAGRLASMDRRISVFSAKDRCGKPTALNHLASAARGEVLVLTDVRQPLVPGALRALLEPLGDPSVACVSGNLVLRGSTGAGIYWTYENWIRKQEAQFRSMLGVTGPLYAIRAMHWAAVPRDVVLDDMWIPFRLRLLGWRLTFAEEAVAYDEAFSDDREFGRKVRTLAGNFQLLTLLPRLLNPLRNPSFFEFFSHKLLRLVCPFVLAALFLICALAAQNPSSTGELDRFVVALWLAQIAFYVLALFPRLGGKFGAVARSFVVMNLAAAIGLVRHLRRTQKVTW